MRFDKSKPSAITRIRVDSNSKLGIYDVYSIQFSARDPKRQLLVFENPTDTNDYILVDSNFDFDKNEVSLNKMINSGSKWSSCFGNCLENGFSPKSLLGQIIIGMGIAGNLGCIPCGFVSGTYGAVILLGCAGGCN